MKKTLCVWMVAAGMMLLAGCEKAALEVSEPVSGETKTYTLSAFVSDLSTKTTVDAENNAKVVWVEGDSIAVFGKDLTTVAKFVLSEGAGEDYGKFSGTMDVEPAYALYPYSSDAYMLRNESSDRNLINGNVPFIQTVPAGSFDPSAALMVGTISDELVTFHSAVTYLRVKAPEDVTNLAYITVKIMNTRMSGNSLFDPRYGRSSSGWNDGLEYGGVSILPKEGVFVPGAEYYVALFWTGQNNYPAITYHYIDKTSHTAYTKYKIGKDKLKVLSEGNTKILSPLDSSTEGVVTHTATQLWEDGPFFADFNAGSTITDWGSLVAGTDTVRSSVPYYNTDNVGYLIPWHGTEYDNARISPYNVETKIPYLEFDDNSYRIFGLGWRDPSKEEFEQLIDKDASLGLVWTWCDGDAVKYCDGCTLAGFKISGKPGTSWEGNSIFLPAVGRYEGGNFLMGVAAGGSYWTGTQYQSTEYRNNCYTLAFGWNYSKQEIQQLELIWRYCACGHAVRPVLGEPGFGLQYSNDFYFGE